MKRSAPVSPTGQFVSVRDLAREFEADDHEFSHWLLRHDITLRRQSCIDSPGRDGRDPPHQAVLTAADAARARFIYRHGVLLAESFD